MSTTRRNALGRGLSALLENASTDITTAETRPLNHISEIQISSIEANPFQPRTEFKEEELQELADSIKVHGIIQPVTVRKLGYDRFQLISGERRTRAARMAGLKTIPAYVRLADDQGMLEMALIENIQREELNAMEVAISYKRLVDECSLNMEQLGERVGKNRSTINNYLRLLKLPNNIQAALRDDLISMGHARAIINIEDTDEQQYLFNQMIERELSVREVESLVRMAAQRLQDDGNGADSLPVKKSRHKAEWNDKTQNLFKHIGEKYGTKVRVKADAKGRGVISMAFKSQHDMNRILELL